MRGRRRRKNTLLSGRRSLPIKIAIVAVIIIVLILLLIPSNSGGGSGADIKNVKKIFAYFREFFSIQKYFHVKIIHQLRAKIKTKFEFWEK